MQSGQRRVTRLAFCDAIQSLDVIGEEIDMSLGSHLQELRRRHQTLSAEVEEAQRSPATDRLRIAELKKQKLRLKEEITRLSQVESHA
jgi:hypothetical protein